MVQEDQVSARANQPARQGMTRNRAARRCARAPAHVSLTPRGFKRPAVLPAPGTRRCLASRPTSTRTSPTTRPSRTCTVSTQGPHGARGSRLQCFCMHCACAAAGRCRGPPRLMPALRPTHDGPAHNAAHVADASEKFDPRTEEVFKILQVLSACAMSFAHGANDIANAVGPFAAALYVYENRAGARAARAWHLHACAGLACAAGMNACTRPPHAAQASCMHARMPASPPTPPLPPLPTRAPQCPHRRRPPPSGSWSWVRPASWSAWPPMAPTSCACWA